MRLKELAEQLQQPLKEGEKSFIIYQQGRQWKYEAYEPWEPNQETVNEVEEKKYFMIKQRLDDKAIIINGKKDFDPDELEDLDYIQNQIKKLKK